MLTGIKPTGYPHLGIILVRLNLHYKCQRIMKEEHCTFIADYHALNAVHDSEKFSSYTKEVAATWLSLGLGEDVVFIGKQKYRKF